jgi:hypothetical protein
MNHITRLLRIQLLSDDEKDGRISKIEMKQGI